jgi:hypothetical protein
MAVGREAEQLVLSPAAAIDVVFLQVRDCGR